MLSDSISKVLEEMADDKQDKLTQLDFSISNSISSLVSKSNGIIQSIQQS